MQLLINALIFPASAFFTHPVSYLDRFFFPFLLGGVGCENLQTGECITLLCVPLALEHLRLSVSQGGEKYMLPDVIVEVPDAPICFLLCRFLLLKVCFKSPLA